MFSRAATASVLYAWIMGLLLVLLALPPSVDAELASDPTLYVTLSFLTSTGQRLKQSVSCSTLAAAFHQDLQLLNTAACTIPGGVVSAVPYNDTACTFALRPPNQGDAMVSCFDAVVGAPWGSPTTWNTVLTTLSAPLDTVAATLRVNIGKFVHEDNEQGGGYRSGLILIGAVFAVIVAFHFLDACGVPFAHVWSSSRAQVISCLVVVAAILCGILLYLSDVLYKPTPLITASYPLKVDSCYITLQDVTPWDIQEAIDAITVAYAAVQFTSVGSTIASQWPCSSKVFYNPYHVLYDAHGGRIPLSITLTSSSLVVSSRLNATNVPLVVTSTPHQLKANRAYLSGASFYSVTVNFFSGIGYVSNSVTDPSQVIEVNTTSVFVVSGEAANPKHVDVRHVSNPPLFCIGPEVDVTFNASACTGGTAPPDSGASSGGGGSGSGGAGGNETYRGYSGTCTLEANDPVNASSPSVQNLKVRCVSFYALPSRPAPISNKTVGSGFETPPELSRPILQAINTSSEWASTALFDDYVQSIEIVTPLLGILMLNSNNPSILTFFPELLVWFTGFVLQPPFRTLQAVPDHFTCDDDMSIEGLVPPASTMITYLDNNVLLYPDERFADKILMPTFLAVDQQANTLTTFQLPYEARKAFPGVHRSTIVDTTIEEVQRPLIADILILISSVLSFLLVVVVAIAIALAHEKLYNFFALESKRSVVESTLKRFEKQRAHGGELASSSSGGTTTKGTTVATAGPSDKEAAASGSTNPNGEPNVEKKSCNDRFVALLDRIEYPAEVIVRVVNGFSYRVVSMVTQWITSFWSGEHASLKCYVRTYTEVTCLDTDYVNWQEFCVFYRAFCQIFDRVDGQEYKKPKKLLATLKNVVDENNKSARQQSVVDPKKLAIEYGSIRGIKFAKPQETSFCCGGAVSHASTLFEEHVRQVKFMFDDNNVNFSFISSRCFKGLHWYDRFVRHPFAISNAQIFVYCFMFLIPISFAMFSLFSLEMAQQPYQIYGVNFRTINTVGAFLPLPQVQPTMQFVLVWTFYVAFGSVMFERLIHSLHHALPRCDPNSDSTLLALLRIPFLRFTFRLILSVVYILCCMYSVGYIFLVALWWILTCFLAPNVMIPFAASSISLITSVWGVYKALSSCKQKLSDQLNAWIQKEVYQFLEEIHFVVGDKDVTIVEETTGDDKAKFIASSAQLPLQVVRFALNSKDESCRRDLVTLLAAPASPEFCNLLTFASGTTTDVDDVSGVLQPFVDLLLGSSAKGKGNDLMDPKKQASADLLIALVKSLVLPQADESRLNDDVIRSAVMNLWKATANASIDAKCSAPADKGDMNLWGLRKAFAAISVFLKGRRLGELCHTLLDIWPQTFDDKTDAAMTQWHVLLPVVGSLSWLLDDAAPFQPTFDLLIRCLAMTSIQDVDKSIYSDVETLLLNAVAYAPPAPGDGATIEVISKRPNEGKRSNDPSGLSKRLLEGSDTEMSSTKQQAESTKSVTAKPVPLCMEDKDVEDAFSGYRQLYESLKSFTTTGAAWKFDPHGLESAQREEEDSLMQKWVRSMRLGKEWPTLLLRRYLPTLNTDEFDLLLKYSIAGINPGSFAKVYNGWQSSSSRSIRQREVRCAGAWIVAFPNNLGDIGLSLEAYYYRILDVGTTREEAPKEEDNNLLKDCIRISCPSLYQWCSSRQKAFVWDSTTVSSGDKKGTRRYKCGFLQSYLEAKVLTREAMEVYWELVNAPVLGDDPSAWSAEEAKQTSQEVKPEIPSDDAQGSSPKKEEEAKSEKGTKEENRWMDQCRRERTPLCILGCKTFPNDIALQELRRATGLLIIDRSGNVSKSPTLFDAACTLSLMQASAPEASLQALVSKRQDEPVAQEDHAMFSPSDYQFLPQCGIVCVTHKESLTSYELQVRTNSIIAAAARRGEPLFAVLAVFLSRGSANPITKTRAATTLVAQLAPGALPSLEAEQSLSTASRVPDNRTLQSLLQTSFKNLPALASEIFCQVVPKASNPLTRLFALVSLVDVLGKNVRTEENGRSRSMGSFSPLDGPSLDALIDLVVGPGELSNDTHKKNLVSLKVIVGIAAGSDIDERNVNTMLGYLPEKLKITIGMKEELKPFIAAARYFSSESTDTFGILAEGVFPLLKDNFGSLFDTDSVSNVYPYAIAHIARQHRYGRRAPALVELFRNSLTSYLPITPVGVLVPPTVPVDDWLSRLQHFSNDRSVRHLRIACSTCLGLSASDTSWNLLQQYVNLQNSAGKVRASAIDSTFNANVATIARSEMEKLVKKLKSKSLFAPLADSLEEQLSGDPDATLDKLSEKLVVSLRQFIIEHLHMSNSDIAYILAYVCALLSGLVAFVLLGILAFSNGSTFSSLIGVAFPAAGGSFSQYDTTSLLDTLTEKARDKLQELSHGPNDETATKHKVD